MSSARAHIVSADIRTQAFVRQPLDLRGSLLMLFFCLMLGLQQVAIKAVAADIAPLAQIALRSSLAALLVGLVAWWRGVTMHQVKAMAWPGLFVGLGFASEFTFVALGLGYTTASHMAVFLYTAPVFAALGLHILVPGEQLAARHWTGIAVAFAGVALAMAPGAGSGEGPGAGALLIGDLLGLLAGMSWAATTVIVRRTQLSEAPPVLTVFYQLMITGLLLLPVAALNGDLASIQPTPLVLSSMAFQTLVISFAALLLWFALLRRYLASRLGVFSFLTPIFGVAFGALLLDEPLAPTFIVGGMAIIAGVILVSRPAPAARARASKA